MNKENETPFKFLGIGSAFNPDLGNNNVFLAKENDFLLIDCGGLTFSRIMQLNLLDNVKKIDIIITHTHTDHIGSLADLIFYIHYIMKITPKIYFPEADFIRTFLRCVGVEDGIYEIFDSKEISIDLNEDKFNVQFIPANHVPNIPCYSLLIDYMSDKVFFSADSKDISHDILEKFKNREIDYMFQDTSGLNYPGNVHMPFELLCNEIPNYLRSKVYCMHYDKALKIADIIDEGFNMVHVYNKRK